MLILVCAVAVFAVIHAYAAVLAVGCLLRDTTLEAAAKAARIFAVVIVPVVESLFVLRSAADVSPEALPARRWLRPLMPLLRVKPHRSSDREFDADEFGIPPRIDD